jgi:transposase
MARKPVMPNAENCSEEQLLVAAKASPTQRGFVRLSAMRTLIMGFSHPDAARLAGVSLSTLYEWVRRFNASGIDGMIDQPRMGRPRKVPEAIGPELAEIIEHPQRVGVTHWTGVKFHGYLRQELELEVGYRTVTRWLRENDFRLKVPQPWPDRQDEVQRQAFIGQLKGWLADENIDLWYFDECGVEGDPRPRRRWAVKGSKPRVTKNGDHLRMNVAGMICPRTGAFYALEFTHNDTEVFTCFLKHANRDVKVERRRNLLIMDNASWHKSRSLPWGQFEPVFLPSYSPDLNPIERLWLLIKAEWFTDFVAKDRDALMQRLDKALNWVTARVTENQRTCAITR